MGDEVWLGRTVFYRVSENDNDNMKYNHASILPAIVVAVWNKHCVNLRVFTDSPGPLEWKTSIMHGGQPGQWDFFNE